MKFLEDPYQTLGAGLALAVGLIVVYLGMAGVARARPTGSGLVVRWVHFLAGITWIGLLYFFNLINAGFLKSLDGPTKNIVIPKLMPAALNWFRHGATVTVLAGSCSITTSMRRRDRGHRSGDRRAARYHHDGKRAWSDLAESEEGDRGSGRCRAGDAGSAGRWLSGVRPPCMPRGSTSCCPFRCCSSWAREAT